MSDIIKSLHLKNFGPWKDQEFSFHPGVNVIVGDSDRGKSAILKGLDFILNDTTPKSAEGALGFITRPPERGKFAENSVVLIHEGEEHKIIRRKGKSINEYQLNDDAPQKANNRTIPEHIKKIINVKPVNYHKQSEPPFLLSELPSAVAKQLAEIINLEEIDETVSFAMSTIRDEKKQVKLKKESLEKMTEELKQLSYVQNLKAMVDYYSDIESKFVNLNSKFNAVDNIFFVLNDLEKQAKKILKISKLSDKISEIKKSEEMLKAKKEKFAYLSSVIANIRSLKKKHETALKISGLSSKIRALKILQNNFEELNNRFVAAENCCVEISGLETHGKRNKMLVDLKASISEYSAKIDAHKALRDKYSNIHISIESIFAMKAENIRIKKQIEDLKSKLENKTCPTCGQKVKFEK